jgi:hypothetical protein
MAKKKTKNGKKSKKIIESAFKQELKYEKTLPGGVQRTIEITKPGSHVSTDDVKTYYANMVKDFPGSKINIRAFGIDNERITLKAMNGLLHVQDYEEYYENRVKDTGKFFNFDRVQITMIVPVAPKNMFVKN